MQSFRPDGRSAPPRISPIPRKQRRKVPDQRISYEDWLRIVARSAETAPGRPATLAVWVTKGFFVLCCLLVAAACGWLLAIMLTGGAAA